jgi:hypothetical protein
VGVLGTVVSACDLDEALSALSDFGKALGTSMRRSNPTLDQIWLEPNMEPCSIRLSKTDALRANGDTGFASYCMTHC